MTHSTPQCSAVAPAPAPAPACGVSTPQRQRQPSALALSERPGRGARGAGSQPCAAARRGAHARARTQVLQLQRCPARWLGHARPRSVAAVGRRGAAAAAPAAAAAVAAAAAAAASAAARVGVGVRVRAAAARRGRCRRAAPRALVRLARRRPRRLCAAAAPRGPDGGAGAGRRRRAAARGGEGLRLVAGGSALRGRPPRVAGERGRPDGRAGGEGGRRGRAFSMHACMHARTHARTHARAGARGGERGGGNECWTGPLSGGGKGTSVAQNGAAPYRAAGHHAYALLVLSSLPSARTCCLSWRHQTPTTDTHHRHAPQTRRRCTRVHAHRVSADCSPCYIQIETVCWRLTLNREWCAPGARAA